MLFIFPLPSKVLYQMIINPSLDKIILMLLAFTSDVKVFTERLETLSKPNNINSIPELISSTNPQVRWQMLFNVFNPEAPEYHFPLESFVGLFKFHFVYDFANEILLVYKEENPGQTLSVRQFLPIFTRLLKSYVNILDENEYREKFPNTPKNIFEYLIQSVDTLSSKLPGGTANARII